ncbi:MAG: alginate lyase family protein [Alistipes sp.]|nr:alginate lyase family protein [Alistipes sp.]
MKKLLLTLISAMLAAVSAAQHPSLLLTERGVGEIRAARGSVPAFDRSLEATLRGADEALSLPIVVPQPRDGGGGYTHEQHKLNYYRMFDCGIAYQMTGEKKYARYVVDMLLAYAGLYPTLGYHPVELSGVPGRIFWQTLNESVWLVHTSIAYDCTYDSFTDEERRTVEEKLFKPYADFVMNGTADNRANNKVFNKMHNHGTWATAAVGMIGMAMGDDDLVDRALYGSDKTGKTGGFIRQLDYLFSPDGYFTEGAYYQRYAIWPFVVFAQCIDHKRPEIGIFEYRDGIIGKAVATLTQLAYEGRFLRFNDALDKGYDAQELIYAVDIAYNADPSNKQLLDIAARYQGKFLPTDAGYAVARDIARGEAQPLRFRSALYRDGRDGSEGGVAAIRSTDPALNSLVTIKATSHGLSHGHYDKLTLAYYDNGNEVLTDYGAARFINIEAKYKGHYTKQNKSFAMQTVAHNTLVADERSHFDGDIKRSSKHHSEVLFTDFSQPDVQIVSAVERNAYEGIVMRRTTAYVTTPFLQYPLILDLVKAESDEEHRYDLPYWYNGHMISLDFPYERALNAMTTLGGRNGYQHIWVEAEGRNAESATSCYTWLAGDRFYSLSTATTPSTELRLVRAGANDPDFNLRGETAYVIRENAKRNHTFCSALESHGTYDLQVEQSANLTASCRKVEVLADTADCTVARFEFEGGRTVTLCVAYSGDAAAAHRVKAGRERFEWTGHYDLRIE